MTDQSMGRQLLPIPDRRLGLGLGGSLLSASIGAAIGILIILMKAGMH